MMTLLKFIANSDTLLPNVLRLLLLVEFFGLVLELLEIIERGWSSDNPTLIVEVVAIYTTHHFLSRFEESVSNSRKQLAQQL
jgi:hypothetical protein